MDDYVVNGVIGTLDIYNFCTIDVNFSLEIVEGHAEICMQTSHVTKLFDTNRATFSFGYIWNMRAYRYPAIHKE